MDKYAKKRAAILQRYWADEWHFRADGTLWIRVKATGKIIECGHIDPGPHKTPSAKPRIADRRR